MISAGDLAAAVLAAFGVFGRGLIGLFFGGSLLACLVRHLGDCVHRRWCQCPTTRRGLPVFRVDDRVAVSVHLRSLLLIMLVS